MTAGSEASALLDRLLADPPAVHAMDFTAEPVLGVWATDRSCYELLARECRPGSRTLETGSGLSTVLLAAVGARHTCVTPSADEVERLVAYCRERSIDASSVRFEVGPSDEVLPRLDGPLDIVLIDGNHGFPQPHIDWYFGASRLVDGGVLVLDDTQLPAVAHLGWVLERDPRWDALDSAGKWAAWRRRGSGPLRQDWFEQPWMAAPLPTAPGALAARGLASLRRRAAAALGISR